MGETFSPMETKSAERESVKLAISKALEGIDLAETDAQSKVIEAMQTEMRNTTNQDVELTDQQKQSVGNVLLSPETDPAEFGRKTYRHHV